MLCGVAAIGAFAVWNSDLSAQTPAPGNPASKVDVPLGLRCVVTLDPAASEKTAISSELLSLSGFTSPNTSEGVLVRLDAEWLVLRDGNYDNWIPRDKVLLMRNTR